LASVSVVESICDRCHTHDEQDLAVGIKNGKYVLPKNWLHIEAIQNNHTLFELDLCEECKGTVLEAAGQGHKVRALRAVKDTA
jgi:hypothetical protein